MKTLRTLAVMAAAATLLTSCAQNECKFNVKEYAERKTEKLDKIVELDDAQEKAVYAVYLKEGKQIQKHIKESKNAKVEGKCPDHRGPKCDKAPKCEKPCAKKAECDKAKCEKPCAKKAECDKAKCEKPCAKKAECDKAKCEKPCAKKAECDKAKCEKPCTKKAECDKAKCEKPCAKKAECDKAQCDKPCAKKAECDKAKCEKPCAKKAECGKPCPEGYKCGRPHHGPKCGRPHHGPKCGKPHHEGPKCHKPAPRHHHMGGHDVRKATREEVKAILTPEQQEALKEHFKKLREHAHKAPKCCPTPQPTECNK